MKKSDLGFFTQHFEKLVLGASVLILVGVGAYAWLGVLGDLHAADGKTASDVRDDIDSSAERLRQAMAKTQSELPSAEEHQVEDYATEFNALYGAPVIDVTQFAARPGGPGLPPIDGPGVNFQPLFLPTPPLADKASIKVKHAVLADPSTLSDAQLRQMVVDVQELVGAQAPVDFQYVSVMTEFPLKAWAERLDAPEEPPLRQIPNNVWLAKLGVAGVYLIREEQDASGNWGNRTVIDPLPQQLAFLPGDELLAEDPMEAAALLDMLQQSQEEVTKPLFPPTALQPWTPPTGADRVLSPDEKKQLDDLESDITRLQRQIDQLNGIDRNERNTRSRRTSDRRTSTRGGGAADGMGMGMGMGGDMGGGGRTTRDRGGNNDRAQAEQAREAERMQRLQDELTEKRRSKNELLGLDGDEAAQDFLRGRGNMGMGMGGDMMGMGMGGDMMGMGMGMDGGMGMGMGQPMPRQNFRQPGQRGNQRDNTAGLVPRRPADDVPETVRVWAHDLTAQPGKTYRYKLVTAVVNPLYQYTRTSPDQRKNNEYRLALPPSDEEIDAAPWTTPVTLDPETYYYFVRGNADQDRATVEVWKVYNGLWRKAEFEESPGNPIGGPEDIDIVEGFKQEVDMAVGAVLLDIDTVESGNTTEVRMVYMLPDGSIDSRLLSADRRHDKRKELEEEAERRQEEEDRFALNR